MYSTLHTLVVVRCSHSIENTVNKNEKGKGNQKARNRQKGLQYNWVNGYLEQLDMGLPAAGKKTSREAEQIG